MRRRPVLVLLVLNLAAAVLLVLTFTGVLDRDTEVAVPAPTVTDTGYEVGAVPGGRDAVEAAVDALPSALSYDYQRLDEDLVVATSQMTPDFAEEFRATFEATARPMATRTKAVAEARVRAAGLVGDVADERAVVLLYVDQVLVSSTTLTDENAPVKITQTRVLVDLLRTGERWKVDSITPF